MSAASKPLISVVIPAYNAQDYIEKTLASVLDQTLSNIEVIVVDDCSTDNTAQIVQTYADQDDRIKYIKAPQNFGGPAGPRNMGVTHAEGDWIAFCDADDLWCSTKLDVQIKQATQENADICATRIQNFPDGAQEPDTQRFANSVDPIKVHWVGPNQMLIKNWVATSSILVKTDVIKAVAPFNTDKSYVAVEDYDMWLRTMEHTPKHILKIDRPLVWYRIVSTSISSGKWKMLQKAMMVQDTVFKRRKLPFHNVVFRPFRKMAYVTLAVITRVGLGRL